MIKNTLVKKQKGNNIGAYQYFEVIIVKMRK